GGLGAGAGGRRVLLGFPRPGFTAADAASASPAALFEPTIWYRVDPSGIVTVSIIRAEMGQHVGTALARIVADELEADWDKVRLDYVDTDPQWGLVGTGASVAVGPGRRCGSHRADRRGRQASQRRQGSVPRAQRRRQH